MSKSEKRKYTRTREFRAEAVKLVLEQGMTLEEASASLALPKGTLANWVSAAKRGGDAAVRPGGRSVSELEAEVARLRKIVKNRGHFPSDEAATKLLFLALRNIEKDWKMPQRTWKLA
ncbi:transposase, partial [Duganella sp. FT50W]|nr:transposase [Duganella lactea]